MKREPDTDAADTDDDAVEAPGIRRIPRWRRRVACLRFAGMNHLPRRNHKLGRNPRSLCSPSAHPVAVVSKPNDRHGAKPGDHP